MSIISRETVEEVWAWISNVEEEDYEQLAQRLEKQQPALYDYALTVPQEFEEDDTYYQFFLTLAIWHMMNEGENEIEEVSRESLQEAEAENYRLVDSVRVESEGDGFAVLTDLYEKYPQPNILEFMLEQLQVLDDEEEDTETSIAAGVDSAGDDEDDEEMDDALRASIFLNLKVMLDGMIKASA